MQSGHLIVDRTVADDDRYAGLTQFSLGQIVSLWAAATAPMALLAWVIAPWIRDRLGGPEPLGTALLITFNVGLVWILVLTLLVVRWERGALSWTLIREALWLRSPRDPNSGRVGGKLWWSVLPFLALSLALNALPIDPKGPLPRDFPKFLETHRAEHFFKGAWGVFALTALLAVLSPVVEELFFRGLLLPRMRRDFGRSSWVVNGAIFAGYHLHQPWSMPASLLDGVFAQAYPTYRFRSMWIAIVCHTAPALVIIPVVLGLVLK